MAKLNLAATDGTLTFPMNIRVVKLGGSLLTCNELPDMLARWSAEQPPQATLWLVGGGTLVDQVRDLDRRFQLPAETCHRLAIQLMAVNARVVAPMLPGATWTSDLNRFVQRCTGGSTRDGLLDPVAFMDAVEHHGRCAPLPASWSVTSDSIAALGARAAGATELMLLKSRLPGSERRMTCAQAVATGYVDEFFPKAARGIPNIRAVNLRDPEYPEVQLLSDASPATAD